MKNHNELTIILIGYKSEKKICQFVRRIPKSIKTIIIENSNNNILKRIIEKKYKNIKVFIKPNEGVSSSLNYAVKKVKTKYFLQISPDIDFNYKDLNIFFLWAKKLNNKFCALGPRFLNVKNKSHKQIDKSLDIGSIPSIHGSFMFINKKIFNKIGKFDKNFFLYFEETEYCKRASKIDLNCYQLNKIKVRTNGRTVAMGNKKEQDKLSNILIWHFIWSKYYYSKKNYGSLISVVIFIPILLRIIIKILFYKVFNNKIKIVKYKSRLNGLLSSMVGKRSSLRP